MKRNPSVKKQKEKKEREKLSIVVKNNWLMLKKIARMTPEYIVCTLLMSVVWGLGNAASSYFTYAVLNEFDLPSPSFGKIAIYLSLMVTWLLVQNGTSAWYFQYYQTIVDKKLQHKMHSELFAQALAMDKTFSCCSGLSL